MTSRSPISPVSVAASAFLYHRMQSSFPESVSPHFRSVCPHRTGEIAEGFVKASATASDNTVKHSNGGSNRMQTREARTPARNTTSAVQFIQRGADKRRAIAYGKARELQRELGVIPRLTSIK
jgi:hypothetical protein